jgi:hypothetical protein
MLTQANNAIAMPSAVASFKAFDLNLTWDQVRDLDLVVWEPDGNFVSYQRRDGYGSISIDSL